MGNVEGPEGISTRFQRPAVVVIMRHGRRLDSEEPRWHLTARNPWDSPLSDQGSAELAGVAAQLAALQLHDAVLVASPFTRCLQTSIQILHHLPSGTVTSGYVCRGISELHTAWLLHRTAHHRDVKLPVRFRRWWWQLTHLSRAAALLKAMAVGISSRLAVQPSPSASKSVSKVRSLQAYPWPHFPETEQEADKRYIKAVAALVTQFQGRDVLIVTHGNCVKTWAEHCLPGEVVDQVKPGGYVVLQTTGLRHNLPLHQSFPMSGVQLKGSRHSQLSVVAKQPDVETTGSVEAPLTIPTAEVLKPGFQTSSPDPGVQASRVA